MRVFHEVRHKRHTLIVCPGNEFPNVSDWKGADGKPLTIKVDFIAGEARVPSNLGQYLLDKGLVQESPLIVPKPVIETPRRGPRLLTA